MIATKPSPTSPNDLLRDHGPTGGLIVRLQRYALLGWVLFFLMLLFHLGMVFVGTIIPRPVVTVDESGRVLGNIEYLKPTARSDQELSAAAMEFARLFLSLNSATIYNDYAAAMNLMCMELFQSTKEAIRTDNYLRNVEHAKSRSWLEFANNAATVLARRDLTADVRVHGTLHVQGAADVVVKPFDMTLGLQIVPRNTLNTVGVCVAERRDN